MPSRLLYSVKIAKGECSGKERGRNFRELPVPGKDRPLLVTGFARTKKGQVHDTCPKREFHKTQVATGHGFPVRTGNDIPVRRAGMMKAVKENE